MSISETELREALAQDVRSQVLTVPTENVKPDELNAKLKALMLEADELRPSWAGEPPDT